MMIMCRWRFCVGAALWCLLWTAGFVPPARAQQPDTSEAESGLVTREVEGVPGVRFKLPADWPIEVRADGVISPISVEDYLARKFALVNTRIKTLEEQILELERRNQALEKVLQSLSKILQEITPPTEEKPKEP
jgi:hypothetical protein